MVLLTYGKPLANPSCSPGFWICCFFFLCPAGLVRATKVDDRFPRLHLSNALNIPSHPSSTTSFSSSPSILLTSVLMLTSPTQSVSSSPTRVVILTSVTTDVSTIILTAAPSSGHSIKTQTSASTSESTLIGSLLPVPHDMNSTFANSPGALIGLVVGVSLASVFIFIWAWLTWRRYRIQEGVILGEDVHDSKDFGRPGRGSVLDDGGSGIGISRNCGNTDIVSSIGHDRNLIVCRGSGEARDSYSPRPYSPLVSDENGYVVTRPASSNGHCDLSSHGHANTLLRCDSSHAHLGSLCGRSLSSRRPDVRSITASLPSGTLQGVKTKKPGSPTQSRSSSLESIMGAVKSDSDAGLGSDPELHYNLSSIYVRADPELVRGISPQSHSPASTLRALISPPPQAALNPPSSLLRPPSNNPSNTLFTPPPLTRTIYMHPPNIDHGFMRERCIPAMSDASVSWGREGLLKPNNPAAESLSSLQDEVDYSRRIGGIISNLRNSMSTARDSLAELEDNSSR